MPGRYDIRTATYRAPAGMTASDAESLARRAIGARPVNVSLGVWNDTERGTSGPLVTFTGTSENEQHVLDACESFEQLLSDRGQDPESFSTSVKERISDLAGGAGDLLNEGAKAALFGMLKRPFILAGIALAVAVTVGALLWRRGGK